MHKHKKLEINVIYGTTEIFQEYNVTTSQLRNLGKLDRIQHQSFMSPTHICGMFHLLFSIKKHPKPPNYEKMMII
ncbi:hypothetical protein SLEP1_g27026 [Rubroshorea leprosula]|uniref:Uncharacterized protein n=1 Tax=Rubroshorea leprosula TaxID=152421 RepID=A0AAV5K1M7_9ROSI|nr:hypothetical protein SLEP1_g27026 [Rubroshorea leprosula]